MKCACILSGVQVHEAKVECSYPLERVQVKGSFETCNRGNILLLSKEAHTYVVPKFAGVWIVDCCNPILQEGSIMITLVLNN